MMEQKLAATASFAVQVKTDAIPQNHGSPPSTRRNTFLGRFGAELSYLAVAAQTLRVQAPKGLGFRV